MQKAVQDQDGAECGMRLGRDTGSIVNHVYSQAVVGEPPIEVGLGCTVLSWSDRDAATIIAVSCVAAHLQIWTQRDRAIVVSGSGHDGSAVYRYERDTDGVVDIFRCVDGRWIVYVLNQQTGRMNRIKSGHGLVVGKRDHYRDPSF